MSFGKPGAGLFDRRRAPLPGGQPGRRAQRREQLHEHGLSEARAHFLDLLWTLRAQRARGGA
eukprot:776893-Pyramimonas_sp.AAC.1